MVKSRSIAVPMVLAVLLMAFLAMPAAAGSYPPPCTEDTPGCVTTPDDDGRQPLLPPVRTTVSQSTLPQTGEDVDTLALLGGGLLVVGVGLVVAFRGRRTG